MQYSDDFSGSVAKNSFWYLDTDHTTANTNLSFESRRLLTQALSNDSTGGAKNINFITPLNRYSFFEELEIQNDDELIYKANAPK